MAYFLYKQQQNNELKFKNKKVKEIITNTQDYISLTFVFLNLRLNVFYSLDSYLI